MKKFLNDLLHLFEKPVIHMSLTVKCFNNVFSNEIC